MGFTQTQYHPHPHKKEHKYCKIFITVKNVNSVIIAGSNPVSIYVLCDLGKLLNNSKHQFPHVKSALLVVPAS